MKKLVILVIFICVAMLGLKAQDRNEISLNTGIHYDVFHIANDGGNCKPAIMAPVVKLNYNTYFLNNTFVSTGIGFHNYSLAIKIEGFGLFDSKWGYSYDEAYLAGFVPVYFGYKFDLTKKLHLLLSMGFDAEVYFYESVDSRGGVFTNDNVFQYENETLYNRFNLLLGNEVLVKYQNMKGFGIGLFASYHAGIFRVFESSGTLSYDGGETVYSPEFVTNGSYFATGLSLSKAF
jgi:hypothetical protein